MDHERLDIWLDGLDPPARVVGVSMLDGYLTAIVVGPCSIPPDEWLDDLFGARGHVAVARGAMLAAIGAIVARFNVISEGLSNAPDRHAPIFEKTEDGLTHPHPWCVGVLMAMRLRETDWRPMLDTDRSDYALLLPILLYCADVSGMPLPAPLREGPELGILAQTAYQDIPLVIPAIREYWMPKRVREANGQR